MHIDYHCTSAIKATDFWMWMTIAFFFFFFLVEVSDLDRSLNFMFLLTGDQLFLGVNEPLTFAHYQEHHRGVPAGRENTDFYYGSLCSAAHQWDYIAAHVQLTQDRWFKFTSNQCRGWSDGKGSPYRPTGPPQFHCHWRRGSIWHVWSGDSMQVYPLWNWNACQRVFMVPLCVL